MKARRRSGSLVATAASRSGSRLIPRAPEVNGVRAGLGGQWRVGRGKGGVGGTAGRRGSNGAAAGAAMMASGCRGGRRARSSGVVMAQRSEAAAGRQQGSEHGCAVAQRAGGSGACSAARAGRRKGGERVRVESQLFDSFQNSKFSIETRKTLNTKVVQNVEIYNFCFGQKFI